MKALLICPSDRENSAFLSRRQPLALVPLLGRSALDLAMTHLARHGAKEITILASDRPVAVRAAVACGKAWGVQAEVISEPREFNVEEARAKYKKAGEAWLPEPLDAITMEGWPEDHTSSLWQSPKEWFSALKSHFEEAGSASVGMKQIRPSVWVSTKCLISSSATLHAPCWIGQHAWIAPGSVIGPDAVIEQGACVDNNAEVRNSHVAPMTYVGAYVEVRNSLAWGASLLNLENDSQTVIEDSFLLSDISLRPGQRSGNLAARLMALPAMLAGLPVLMIAAVRCIVSGEDLFIRHRCVAAPVTSQDSRPHNFVYYELNGVSGLWRRLPELLNVFRREFYWVGNRPLTLDQAAALTSEYERLWLTVPTGLFSLADSENCAEPFGDAAMAHAAYYATCRKRSGDMKILFRALARCLRFRKAAASPDSIPSDYPTPATANSAT